VKLVSSVCGKCGAEIPADARPGACPACLLETGLGLLAEEVQTPNPPPPLTGSAGASAQRPTSNAEFRGEGRAPKPARMITNFGDYELLEEIGRGGQGVVYRARQKSLNRTVALKVIGLGHWATEAHLKRFRREAEAAASLEHPSIVPIYEVGERDGCCYFSMKFIEGGQLDEVVRRAPMSIRQAAELIAKVARTVHYAHEHGILHRDIKPGNVLLDKKGEAHLTDFGLARLVETESAVTRTKEVLGTPSYMAPEQAAGETGNLTSATDVYGLGAVLYQLLTGHPPFAGGTTYETMRLLLDTEPRPPRLLNRKIGRDLSTICLKCLEKEPARRYASAELLAEELDRFCRGEPILARPVGWAERSWRWCRREPALAGLAAALVVVLIIGFIGVVWKWRGEVSQRELAQQENQRAQRAVTRLEIERAESLLEAGDSSRGLAYLARLLRQQPTNHVVAERLMSALTYRSFCLPVAPLRHGNALNSLTGQQMEWFMRSTFFPFFYPGSLVMADFSPDSWRVVTASEDGTARLWNALTGESLGDPMRHEAEVLWAQFSGDGQRIVTASVDGAARIWRADTSQLATPLLRHGDIVHFATFNPDGQKVVTASRDNTARIWNAQTGQPIGLPLIHPKPVYSACFSPDGSRILTADESDHARLWDARTGTAIAAADHFGYSLTPSSPQFSPSGEQVVTFRRRQAFLRDPLSEMAVFARLQHDSFLTSATYSPDGQRIATVSNDSTARIWDTGTGEARISPLRHDSEVTTAHFSSDGQRIVTGSNDKSARLWDVHTGQALTEPMRQEHAVLLAKIGAGGQRLLTFSETDTAWLWDMRLLQPLAVLRWLQTGPFVGRFSPDGRQVVVLDDANAVRVWNAQSGLPQTKPMGHPHPESRIINDVQFSPDGRRLVTAAETVATTPSGYGGEAQIWDASTGEPIGRPLAGSSTMQRARFSPDGTKLVTSSGDGFIRVWDVESGKQQLEWQSGRVSTQRMAVEFSPNGKMIATSSAGATVQIWDAATGRPLGKPLQHAADVSWLVFDRTGQRLATASMDKTARIWSVQTGQMLTPPLVHADPLLHRNSVTFSPDGSRLATAAGSAAQVWDVVSGRAVTTPLRHGGLVRAVQFSVDGRKLLSASEDGTARLWDPETGHPVSEPMRHGARVTSAEFSPDGSQVVTFSSDKAVRIWEVTQAPLPVPDWLPALAEAVAGQHINDKEVAEVLPVEVLYRFRQTLSANRGSDYYGRWARWFFADSATRTISPSSDITVPEYVKRRIEENTRESLQEATLLSSTSALAFARLAQQLVATNQAVKTAALKDAEWFSRYATDLAPTDPEIRLIRESIVQRIPPGLLLHTRASGNDSDDGRGE
jgi:eukaryotic-like serine/threonine-protein kinase